MDGSDVTEVCRLCPANGKNNDLLDVFDERISVKNNMKEIILVTTGIEILENDLISKKICQRCCNITLKMFQFRQDALKQDRVLKEKCSQYLGDKGIRLPNTCITIKQERLLSSVKNLKEEPAVSGTCNQTNLKDILHPSITLLYQTFPRLKLPKACVDQHMTPVVSLPMGEVEKYFKNKKLDMKKFIYKQRRSQIAEHGNKIAKKRTTTPAKQKKITPLKISKSLFGNQRKSVNGLENYFCINVKKDKGGKKRRASLSDFLEKVKNKVVEENERPKSKCIDDAESAIAPDVNTKENERSVTPVRLSIPKVSWPDQKRKKLRPWIPEDSEDSRDSLASNISAATSSASNKERANTLESCGLTPTVTATKSQTLLVCNLCGSVHNNAFELKRHISIKHMVCQFCKRRFKSLDGKQDHIDYDCEVKKIMNSSTPIISLEQIHLNLEIRKKYRNAFSTFEPIAGLQEPEPVEEVIVRAVSPPPPIHQDLIVVSDDDDDDEVHCLPPDPLSGIPTPAAVVYNTVSIVRPDVRIKNSRVHYNPTSNLSDKKIVADLVELFRSSNSRVEKMLQTDLPANKDIKINHSEGTCEFKNLKEQLLTYKVPINVNYGSFHVGYQFKKKPKLNNRMAQWSTLPLVNLKKTNTPNSSSKSQIIDKNATLSKKSQLVIISSSQQHQSTPSVSSTSSAIKPPPPVKPNATSTTPTIPSQIKANTVVCLPTPIILNNRITSQPSGTNQFPFNYTTANSATPLLQHYAFSISSTSSSSTIPITNTTLPIQKTTFNNRNPFQNSSASNSLPRTYSRQNSTLPRSKATYQIPGNIVITTTNTASTSTPTTPTAKLPINLTPSSAGNNTVTQAAATSESSKFRVKNVWELQ